jgi:hypothetical protein
MKGVIAVVGAMSSMLLLTGCSQSTSWVRVTYELEGETISVTTHPDSVSCDDGSVSGGTWHDSGASLFSFLSPDDGGGLVSVSITTRSADGSRDVVYFDAETYAAKDAKAGVVTIENSPGSVRLVENWDADADIDRESVPAVEGTVSAELYCPTDAH